MTSEAHGSPPPKDPPEIPPIKPFAVMAKAQPLSPIVGSRPIPMPPSRPGPEEEHFERIALLESQNGTP